MRSAEENSFFSAVARRFELLSAEEIARLKPSDLGACPSCFVERGQKGGLVGYPVAEAEQRGLVHVGNEASREVLRKRDAHLVFCMECHWVGIPDGGAISSSRAMWSMIEDLRSKTGSPG